MRNWLFSFRLLFLEQPSLCQKDRTFLFASLIGLLIVALVPFVSSSYAMTATRDALILAIFALSYDLIWGKAFTLTLGHAVFFGLGAYGMAIATTRLGWSPLEGILLGMVVAGMVAAVVGYFLLYAGVRLHFFAIMTLAMLLIARQLATSWQSVTGGDVGILGVPPLKLAVGGYELDLSGEVASYYTALGFLALTLLLLWAGLRGNYGKVLAAIGMNEFRAKHCGYKTSFHLLAVFGVSAVLAGFAGALYATLSGVVAPDLFSILLSTEVILWVAIGGKGSLLGAAVATILFTRLQQEVSSYSTELWPLFLGVLFLFCVLALPQGVPGLVNRLSQRAWVRKIVSKREAV